MILRYFANIVEKTFEFSHIYAPAHTQTKTYKETNKTKRIAHKIFLRFTKVGLRHSIAFSDSVVDEQ